MIRVDKTTDIPACQRIRRIVFIDEQNVPEHLEVDGLDEECIHYLVFESDNPIGTARVRAIGNKAKIQRVAILPNHQSKGLGKVLMQKILSDVKQDGGFDKIVLSSQTRAVPFYQALGFHAVGEEYMDAGIAHLDMELHLDQNSR